jgi:hypothetical protein
MDVVQFLNWLNLQFKSGQGSIRSLPRPIESKYWAQVVHDIAPHYYGFIPDAIKKAFPNETAHQWDYRVNIHESMTKDQLWQAIGDVKRLIMSDKFGIKSDIGIKEITDARTFGRYMNQNFERFIFDSVYPRRVLDPNALLACVAVPSMDTSTPVGIDLRMFPSADIIIFQKDLVIVYDRATSKKTGVETYLIFTLTHQLVHRQVESNEYSTEELYWHDANDLCVGPLGGPELTLFDKASQEMVTFYESDFSYAVAKMNTLERKNNQLEAATLRVVFPHMVTQGLKCETCDGEGKVVVRDQETGDLKAHHHDVHAPFKKIRGDGQDLLIEDDQHFGILGGNDLGASNPMYDDFHPKKETCSSCGGSGKIALSVLDNVTVTPPNNEIFDDEGDLKVQGNIADKIIGFASPDISSVQELRTQTTEAELRVSEALNVTKPSKFAESGISKEKDRDGKKTKMQDISDGLSTLSMQALTGMASLRFLDSATREQEQAAIMIVQPQDFEIKPIEDLEKEYFSNLEDKPMVLRRKQFKELLLKRFKNDAEASVLDDLAFMYTKGLHLMTPKELADMEMAGMITRSDMVKAIRIYPILEMLLKMQLIDVTNPPTGARLDQLVDPIIQPLIDAVNNANADQAGMTDIVLEDEDDGEPQQG